MGMEYDIKFVCLRKGLDLENTQNTDVIGLLHVNVTSTKITTKRVSIFFNFATLGIH